MQIERERKRERERDCRLKASVVSCGNYVSALVATARCQFSPIIDINWMYLPNLFYDVFYFYLRRPYNKRARDCQEL